MSVSRHWIRMEVEVLIYNKRTVVVLLSYRALGIGTGAITSVLLGIIKHINH